MVRHRIDRERGGVVAAFHNRSARCNRDAKRMGLRCGATPPHSGPQLRTRKTVFSGSASVAVE